MIYNLAGHYHDGDQPQEAVQTYREAFTLLSMFHDADSPIVASALFGLANALWRMGAKGEALEHAQRAEEIFRQGGSVDDRLWAMLLAANLLRDHERWDDALETFLRAEALIREAEGVGDMERATVLVGIGGTLLSMERLDEAESRIMAGIELAERAGGRQHPVLAYHLLALGKLRMAQKRVREARDVLDRAWTLQVELGDRGLRADVAEQLARSMWQTGEPKRARELWTTARTILVEQGSMDEVAQLDAALVECGTMCQ